MRHPQVLVYEADGRLAALLRPTAEERRWSLDEPRRAETVPERLRRGGPAVLVLRVGRDLEREMTLLERAAWLCPDSRVVVVTDLEQARLAGLAWDLGAAYVLAPPQPRERLPMIVAGLLDDGE
jgi:hypothetical protein